MGGIVRKIRLSERNWPYIPSEAIPNHSVNSLRKNCVPDIMHYIPYLTSTNNQASKPQKIIQKKMELTWKIKLKICWRRWGRMQTRQCNWNQCHCLQMQGTGYMLESGQPPRNIKQVYQIMTYNSTKEECWENPTEFWGKMYSVFHKSTNSEH